jgi:hypothetical protein
MSFADTVGMTPTSVRFLLMSIALTAGLVACDADQAADPKTEDDVTSTKSRLKVFDCKTERKVDDKDQRIQFSVRHIDDNKKVEILTPEGKDDEEEFSPIKTTPDVGRVAALNENLGVSTGSRSLRISGDSDGFFLIELVLFKNTNYENGFLRIFGSEDDGPHQFSKVHCAVTEK